MSDFNNIWIPLADRFYRVAYYLLESEEDAEDALQETMIKYYCKGPAGTVSEALGGA